MSKLDWGTEYLFSTGTTDFGPDAYDRIMRGEVPTPGKLFIAVRFHAADGEHAWLNRVQAIGVGINQGDTNRWDLYALRGEPGNL